MYYFVHFTLVMNELPSSVCHVCEFNSNKQRINLNPELIVNLHILTEEVRLITLYNVCMVVKYFSFTIILFHFYLNIRAIPMSHGIQDGSKF